MPIEQGRELKTKHLELSLDKKHTVSNLMCLDHNQRSSHLQTAVMPTGLTCSTTITTRQTIWKHQIKDLLNSADEQVQFDEFDDYLFVF